MAAHYWRRPTASELPKWYKPEDFEEPHVEVWDENWQAIELFKRVDGQWRMGSRGPIALDYNVVDRAIDRLKLGDVERDELMERLRVCESAALSELHKPA